MNFESLQTVWKSQPSGHDALDRDELQRRLVRQNRHAGWVDWTMIATLVFLAVMFARDPILQGHDRILLVASVASLLAAGWVWTSRQARRKREPRYEHSLLGIVERSLEAIDYQVRRLRTFVWWFLLPNVIGLTIAVWIIDPQRRYLLLGIFIPAFALCMGLTWLTIRRQIRRDLEPERERLLELRQQLVEHE